MKMNREESGPGGLTKFEQIPGYGTEHCEVYWQAWQARKSSVTLKTILLLRSFEYEKG